MLTELYFNENLHVEKNGSLYLGDDRSILISVSAFKTLRKNLIQNIGSERIKGFLFRHGWENGQEDAKKVLKKNLKDIKEAIYYGPILHRLRGNADIEVTGLKMKEENDKISIHMEGIWKNSYEAEEYIRGFGQANSSVCYTLIGYASGYLTKICNQMVIVKELSCQAEGEQACKWVGKSLDYWNGEVDEELKLYQDSPIVKELEMTYEKLLEEKRCLEKSTIIHKKLTDELLQGNDLTSIAEVVFKETDTPGMITDEKHHPLTYIGMSSLQVSRLHEEFISYLMRTKREQFRDINETTCIRMEQHIRLITPIYLQGKIKGYCSFIYLNDEFENSKIHKMILERTSLVISHYLLNEVTKFETEQRMMGTFFDEILRGDYPDEEEVLRRASFIHIDLSGSFRMVVLQYRLQQQNLKEEFIFHEELLKEITNYFKSKKQNILVGHRTKSVIMLIPTSYMTHDGIEPYLEGVLKYLTTQFPEVVFYAGVSKQSNQIGRANESYNEAFTALRMATMNHPIMKFDSLGMVGPLINQNNKQEIRQVASNLLGDLIDPLSQKKIELLKTLYLFLANGGNLELTAKENTLSLSGLRYRIAKIEDSIGHNLRDPFYNYQVYLALQSLILIGDLDLNQN
ncbi:XylR N-terminal domain-containing protein [Niallia sp. Krafla_26]|uniref:XylR N-terminal domain-containing protein n=1 Tax=Niallia sp. Krafla_26 TaxID=3064703 RepID=UPI003D170C85